MAKAVKTLQKRRLLKLAKMLEEDARNKKGIKFDIGVVGRSSDITIGFKSISEAKLDCGTTACAMGLAALSGKFKKDGLTATVDPNTSYIETKWNGRRIYFNDSARKLFGIDDTTAAYLFSPYSYPSYKRTGAKCEWEVVRRIKRIAAGGKAPRVAD